MATEQHYYRAKADGCYFVAQIYHYDESGNRIIPVWTSSQKYNWRNEAEDAAAEWLEGHPEIDAELDG